MSGSDGRSSASRAAVSALALVLLFVASGCHGTAAGGASGGLAGPIPSGSPGATGPAGDTVAPSPAATQLQPARPPTGSASGNLVTLSGQARSVETTAAVAALTEVHLTGPSVLTATGDVVDRTGRDLGAGTLRVAGSDVVVTGPAMQLVSRLRVQPAQVTVNNGIPGGTASLALSAVSTISAASMTFQPQPQPQPRPPAAPATPASTGPTTTVAPPVPVAGPVRVQAGTLQVTGASVRWVDAPATYRVVSSETDLSWAGSGTITTGAGPIQAGFLGVRAQQLDVTIRRGSASVDVQGTGLALQAYANGVPQLRTPARVDVVSTHATTGFLGRRRAFVWTPRNLGSTYDMAILRIRPGNAAAGNVHIGLRPMPPMFGGEAHALVGGDTSGLKSGDAIDSLIARNGDDKRSVGYDGAAGVNIVLVLEGNFDPIVVSVTTS